MPDRGHRSIVLYYWLQLLGNRIGTIAVCDDSEKWDCGGRLFELHKDQVVFDLLPLVRVSYTESDVDRHVVGEELRCHTDVCIFSSFGGFGPFGISFIEHGG